MKLPAVILAALATAFATDDYHLVVHEWGTITSIAGKDGIALEWRPLAGTNDLPGFVYEVSASANETGLQGGDKTGAQTV